MSGTHPTCGSKQCEHLIIVGPAEQKRIMVRRGMNRDGDAGLAPDFSGAIIDFGSHAEFAAARALRT